MAPYFSARVREEGDILKGNSKLNSFKLLLANIANIANKLLFCVAFLEKPLFRSPLVEIRGKPGYLA